MQLTYKNNIGFSVDAANQIYRTMIWEIMPDTEDYNNWEGFRQEVEEWIGQIGDPVKVPNSDGISYYLDDSWVVTAIKADSQQLRNLYTVSYTARKKNLDALMTSYNTQVNNNLEREINAVFIINDESLEGWLPRVGDVVIWIGQDYYCDNISSTRRPEGEWEVRLKIKDMSTLMLGLPSFRTTRELEQSKTARWRIAAENIDEFLMTNNVGQPALWAGEDFVITSRDCSSIGIYGYQVTLTAVYSGLRLIDIRRSERLKHIEGWTNEMVREITYTGRWRVHEEELEIFNGMTGNDASEWSEAGFIVASVERRRSNPGEWEITMTAKEPEYIWSSYDDFFDGFTGDTESNVELTYQKLTAQECGWLDNNSEYEEYSEWDNGSMCPLLTNGPLPVNLIETPLECFTVTLISYKQGEPHTNMVFLKNWLTEEIIFNGSLQGRASLYGSWRKAYQTVSRYVHGGEVWTRVVRKWENAPRGYQWNPGFFE